MDVRKVAKAIYDECRALRRVNDGAVVASQNPNRRVDVYHVYGTSAQAYSGDTPKEAFKRIIFRIELNEIDWSQPLKEFIEEKLCIGECQ